MHVDQRKYVQNWNSNRCFLVSAGAGGGLFCRASFSEKSNRFRSYDETFGE